MEIKSVKIEKLKPYDKNPRRNQEAVSYVAKSIKEFGFKVPIVIDKNNVIVCGHTRYLACKQLGYTEAPCIVADDLSEEQIRAFRLADNKVAEFSAWDDELLDNELEFLANLDLGFEMEEFGFDLAFDEPEDEKEPEEENLFEDIEKMEKHYGVPYQGNKSRIADIIIDILPGGKRLVDLFGGGGAITHCGLLSEKWYSHLYNDINPLITTLFIDAINGKYHDENRVITREEFFANNETDPFIRYIWSFGNKGDTYLWGKDIEEIKQQACRIILDDDKQQRRLNYSKFVKMLKNSKCNSLDRLQSIEHLQALTQLEALQRLEALQVSNISYQDYEYKEGDIVYCDVPYEVIEKEGCTDYGLQFNSKEFYEWCKTRPYQVFFSSYEISDPSFSKIKIKDVMSLIGSNTNGQFRTEYLYSNRPIVYKGETYETSIK